MNREKMIENYAVICSNQAHTDRLDGELKCAEQELADKKEACEANRRAWVRVCNEAWLENASRVMRMILASSPVQTDVSAMIGRNRHVMIRLDTYGNQRLIIPLAQLSKPEVARTEHFGEMPIDGPSIPTVTQHIVLTIPYHCKTKEFEWKRAEVKFYDRSDESSTATVSWEQAHSAYFEDVGLQLTLLYLQTPETALAFLRTVLSNKRQQIDTELVN